MTFFEEIFHRVFGERGVTGTELETAGARRDLQSIQEKLVSRIGTLSEGRRNAAIALSAEISRHLQTYPETPTELAVWNSTTTRLIRDARKYIGLPPAVIGLLIGMGAATVIGVTIYRRSVR